MKAKRFFILMTGLVLFNSHEIYSQTVSGTFNKLVSAEWLENNLSDPQLIILHYGNQEDFQREHIPNARFISLKELIVEKENGLRHELPDKNKIESVFRSWGINNDSKIVICFSDENGLPMAARLYFTLDYAGMGDQSAILNGGFPEWKKEKRSLTDKNSAVREGSFRISEKENVLAFKDWVYANLRNRNVFVIDARPEEQYAGTAEDKNSPRNGHIEGAVNIPFFTLARENAPNIFKSVEELKKLFEKNYIPSGSTLVIYCGSGIWASPVYFAGRLLGYNTLLYDGSFQEWGNDNSLPVTEPVKLKK